MPYPDSDYERSWKMHTKGVMLYPATLERLYAAAPALLAACKRVRELDTGDQYWSRDRYEVASKMMAEAINKAEGRSE